MSAQPIRARGRDIFSSQQDPERLLVRGADRRHHARIRLHSAAAVDASAGRRRCGIRPRRPLIDKAAQSILARQLPDGGFNIYVKGTVGDQRHGQGVLRAEAGGLCRWTIRAWRARGSASWRWAAFRRPTATSRSTSACSTCIRASTCPSIPPEIDAAAGQLPLPDVVVDAGHRGVAFDRACARSAAAGAGRIQSR